MQNRYVSDIGDYVKLAILRALAGDGMRIGVAWWLFPDEVHNADGGHREYLDREDEWKHFDPELFKALLQIKKAKSLNVRALEETSVLRGALFAGDPVPCDVRPFSQRPAERYKWLKEVKTKLKDCNLVFLDPDNGIAREGLKLTRRRAGKSVTVQEICELQKDDRTVVVYHQQSRFKGGHLSEIYDLGVRLRGCGLKVSGALRARPWSPRLFFILNGDRGLQDRAKRIADRWNGHISWHPDTEILNGPK